MLDSASCLGWLSNKEQNLQNLLNYQNLQWRLSWMVAIAFFGG